MEQNKQLAAPFEGLKQQTEQALENIKDDINHAEADLTKTEEKISTAKKDIDNLKRDLVDARDVKRNFEERKKENKKHLQVLNRQKRLTEQALNALNRDKQKPSKPKKKKSEKQ